MKSKKSKQKGFTMIELLAVMAITAIVSGIIMSLFISAQKSFISANNENIIQDEARTMVEFLENDIKIGKKRTSTDGIGKVEIDSKEYTCAFATGQSISAKYAYQVKNAAGDMETYIYLVVGKKLIKGKAKVTGSGASEVRTIDLLGTLTTHLESFDIPNGSVVKINFKLKAGSSENDYSITVTPRNG